ncbi:LysR family transcriptional regulator [uncultured Sulfitobacter sp.]|uniref:LysR family transcriptional regulator n=1 Tax=uncultured Sulfitobacter sp. TaxID=191468 RepID=UPI002637966A|nr:LysR family transcriptional regulator [uncultured Sulfitobacter sp.]
MDWRDLPPLSSLRAFAAFAEEGSVVAAGDALGVSHAAISQQLRSLEAHLDLVLLDRSGRALALTPDGIQMADAVRQGFGGMISMAQVLTGARAAQPLHISLTPTFAASWLMPRLPRFREKFANVDLMLNPTPKLADLGPDGVDLAIRHGTCDWPGLECEMLVQSPIVVVAAPSLVGTDGPVPKPADLARLPWLEELGRSEADSWLEQQGVHREAGFGMTQLPGNLLLEGARSGQGIAVTVRCFVEDDIAAGRLRVVALEDAPGAGYYLVTKPGVMRPALKSFVQWLRREAKADLNRDQS